MIKESVITTSENNQKYISTDLFQRKSLSDLKKMSAKELFDLGKLRYPLYKSSHDESYSVITYQEAIKIIARIDFEYSRLWNDFLIGRLLIKLVMKPYQPQFQQ